MPVRRLRPSIRAACAVVVVLAAGRAAADGETQQPSSPLVNPSFEEWGVGGTAGPAIAPPAGSTVPAKCPIGWETFEGARDGATEQRSEMTADREFLRDGAASLRFSGGAGTTSWHLLRQRVAVLPGQRVTLRVATKSVNVRKEGRQYPNAHAFLEFTDAKGARLEMSWTPPLAGTRDWCDQRVSAFVPDKATSVWVGMFLSQSGTLWFDDVRLSVAPGSAADAEGRTAAFEAAEAHLRATYPFFGLGRKPAADALFAKWRERCIGARDEDGFAQSFKLMLGDLDDLHVWVRRGQTTLGTATATTIRPNLDPAAVRAAVTDVVDEKPPIFAGRIGAGADAVGYVAIASWRMEDAAVARLEAALDALADCRGLVIDVRMNAGGDEMLAQRIASRFAAADVVYARSRVRDASSPDTSVLLPPTDRVLPARKGAKPDARPVAVLQGRWCMSSCEGFLLMCRALPTVTTVGVQSRGASGNPQPFVVVPGFVMHSSTWRAYAPDSDESIEGRGVAPEIEVKAAPGGGNDPVLAKALEVIRGG